MQRPHCEQHAQRPAVARCAECGKYLCRECMVEAAARPWCRECAARTGGVGVEKAAASPREDAYGGGVDYTDYLKEAARPGAHPDQSAAQQVRPIPAGEAPQPYPRAPSPGETAAPGQGQTPPPARSPAAPSRNPEAAPYRGGPVAARVVATCAYHPGVKAVSRCAKCSALICAGCRRVEGDKSWCEACWRAGHTVMAGDKRAPTRNLGTMDAVVPWKLWPGLAFLPVPFLLNGLMTYMMRQGEEISVGAAQLLISLLLYSSTLAFAFLVVYRYGSPLEEVGFGGRNLPSSLGLGLLGGCLSFWLAVAGGLMSAGLLHSLESVERWLQGFFDVNVKSLSGADVFIAGLIIIVAAPVCEEIFFRGYLYPAMRNRMGLWGAAFLNGFLFSAVHFSVFGLIGRTVAGVIFCLLYEYNDNLWSPVAAHAMNNFVAFFLPLVFLWSS